MLGGDLGLRACMAGLKVCREAWSARSFADQEGWNRMHTSKLNVRRGQITFTGWQLPRTVRHRIDALSAAVDE